MSAGEEIDVVALKRTRGLHAQELTDVLKTMEKAMISYENKATVTENLQKLDKIFKAFEDAHKACEGGISDQSAWSTLDIHFQSVAKDYGEMKERVKQWFDGEAAEDKEGEETQSVAGSAASAASQARYRTAQTKRALAELKAKQLAEQQEFERRREELDRERAEFDRKRLAFEQKRAVEEAILEESMSKRAVEEEISMSTPEPVVMEPVAVRPKQTEPNPPTVNMDNAILKLAETLQEGFNLPKPELLTFSGNPAEYRKFITNFETNLAKVDDSLKLSYLIQYCVGEAKRCIEDCVLLGPSEGYKRAREILYSRYGRPHLVARSHLEKLIYGPQIKPFDVEGLSNLALDMCKCEINLSQMGFSTDIDNSENLRRIVRRLPGFMKTKWVDIAHSIQESGREPRFSDLVKFVDEKSRVASSVYGMDLVRDNQGKDKIHNQKQHSRGRATTLTTQSEQKYACSCCNGKCSNLEFCDKFKGFSLDERRAHLRKQRLCDNCFRGKHIAPKCRKESNCSVPECKFKHHTLMHKWSQGVVQSSVNCAATKGVSAKCAMGIIPVVVEGKNGKSCETYALLDNGADKSLCDERLLNKLGMRGNPITFNIATVNSNGMVSQGREIDIVVKPVGRENGVSVNKVWSVKKLPISKSLAIDKAEINKWPHLNGVTIPEINAHDVMLLIGIDAPGAHIPLEVRSGNDADPYAVRTQLGWAVRGPTQRSSTEKTANVNFQSTCDDELQANLERLWKTDFSEKFSSENSSFSMEDKRAVKQMEESVQLESGHYKIGLPWREPQTVLPNSLPLAHVRLEHLRRKLQKDENLHKMYTETVNDYIQKGYAKKVIDVNSNSRRIWYLPHHPVTSENKPNKVRVVFDCAAKYKGVSLNNKLLQGPDFVNSLVGVLVRFRQDRVAIAADVEAMFHQVRVSEEDQDALRFLWWPGGDLTQEPLHYCMQVHLFGATSSPSVAAYAMKKTASDNGDKFSEEAVSTVQRNFYVDDCLKSVETTFKAKQLVTELRSLLSMGGFRLTKWLSNDKEVIASVPQSEREKSIVNLSLDDDSLPKQRALGLEWDVEDDVLGFKIKTEEKPYTRRGILSTVSSLFDPLGLVSPVTLKAKAILQELCRENYGWDDTIPDSYIALWREWLENLPRLGDVKVRRCLKRPDSTTVQNTQLHIFSDASEKGFGACAYLRTVDQDDKIHCSLIMGKSRLAPIKQVSIPRLELSAAVVSCRLYGLIDGALDVKIDKTHFWTDSTIVLGYIKNESRRFKTFVANRLTTIHDSSKPEQWRHVDTKSNPADLASRGINANDQESLQAWLNGPEFLWKGEKSWPEDLSNPQIDEADQEVKKEVVIATVIRSTKLTEMIDRYSDWHKLQRAFVWLHRFTAFFRQRHLKQNVQVNKDEISVDELRLATRTIFSYVQRDVFREEWSQLKDKKCVNADSKIACMNPVFKDGLIKSAGRLAHSDLEEDTRIPIILPSKHHVSSLIIRYYHNLNGHVGSNQVLTAIRQRFWIMKGRAAVKRQIEKCLQCKRRNAVPMRQQMAPLPPERVTPDRPPFTFVGVDYFGPLFIKSGRGIKKRYGCLFTCLATRAVHLEIAHSLDTSSFLCAFQRFASRRGKPEKVYSDNGTNFTGGEKELRESLDGWNQERINRHFLQSEVEWHFNPPHASHMGGVWERMIRSTRHILKALIKEQLLTDEQLVTVMAEVERIINDRPITYVSSDVGDPEALTPSKLLLLKNNSCLPVGTFDQNDQYAKRWWRQAQYISNVFWKRWLREYLPALQIRDKWQRSHRNVGVGDMVLVVDEKAPRGQWPLGRVTSVNMGRDQIVRSCTVKCGSTELARPITKLCLLESAN